MKNNTSPTDAKTKDTQKEYTPTTDFSSNTFELASERAALLTAERPQGSNALGYTKKVIDALDAAKDKIKKKYFGNNSKLGDEWEADWNEFRQRKIDDAYQYEVAQVVHGAKEDNKLELAKAFAGIGESVDLTSSSAIFVTGAGLEEASDDLNTQMDNAKLRNESNPIAEDDPDKEQKIAEQTSEKIAFAEKSKKNLELANKVFSTKMDFARQNVDAQIKMLHRSQYDYARKVLGRSHEASVAFANIQIQNNTKKMIQDMVSTNPESAKHFLAWLARPNATKVEEVDKDGKPVVGNGGEKVYSSTSWNPLGRWCLSSGDVSELIMSAESQIETFRKKKKLRETADLAQDKVFQERMQIQVDKWKGEALLKIAKGELSTVKSPKEMVDLFVNDIEVFHKMGYRKTDELLTEIQGACDKYFLRKSKEIERVSEMSEATKREYHMRRLLEYQHSTVDDVTAVFTTPDGRLKKTSMERRAALICTIDALLIDPSTDTAVKDELRRKRDELKSERDIRNAQALEILARKVGFSLPTEQMKSFVSYKDGEYQTIDGAPSYQSSDSLLFGDKGEPLMGSQMKAQWTDPDNPNSTITLGKNEVREIFGKILGVLNETPEDDLAALTAKSHDGKKNRVELMFLNAVRAAKMTKESNDIYSAMSSAIRTGERGLFDPKRGGSRRMGFLRGNFTIPPLVIKKTTTQTKAKPEIGKAKKSKTIEKSKSK